MKPHQPSGHLRTNWWQKCEYSPYFLAIIPVSSNFPPFVASGCVQTFNDLVVRCTFDSCPTSLLSDFSIHLRLFEARCHRLVYSHACRLILFVEHKTNLKRILHARVHVCVCWSRLFACPHRRTISFNSGCVRKRTVWQAWWAWCT